MTTVLFLGLGHMGGPMAANLAAAGHRVLGFDLVPEALEKARAAGVETVTDTAAAAAANACMSTISANRAASVVHPNQASSPSDRARYMLRGS